MKAFTNNKSGVIVQKVNSIDDVAGLQTELDNLSSSMLDYYWTTETPTKKRWTNGEVIYRKVIDTGAMPNNSVKTVSHGISGVQTILTWIGYAKTSGGTTVLLPRLDIATFDNMIYVTVTPADINITTKTNLSTVFPISYFIVEYLKV